MIQRGFTLVELMVVIVIIGLLASAAAFNYGPWQRNIAQKALSSDLLNAQTAMKNASNFDGTYPSTMPSSYTGSPDTTLTLTSVTPTTYCVEGTRTVGGTAITWHILQTGDPVSGGCS